MLGGKREASWIGSPALGARSVVTRANSPFRKLELIFLLANPEIPLLWLLEVLCQGIVSTRGPLSDGDIVEHEGRQVADVMVEMGHLPLEVGEGGLIVEG